MPAPSLSCRDARPNSGRTQPTGAAARAAYHRRGTRRFPPLQRQVMQTTDPAQDSALLEMLERAVSIGVWRLDTATGALRWSDHLADLHGAPHGYVPQGDPLQHFAPENTDKLAHLLAACMGEGTPFDEEAQIIRLDGRRAWVRVLGQPVRDASGAIIAVQGAVQEIAPRGLRPGTLLRMGAALGSGEAFATVDRNGQYTYLNEKAEQLLGADSRQLLGRRLWNSFQKTV